MLLIKIKKILKIFYQIKIKSDKLYKWILVLAIFLIYLQKMYKNKNTGNNMKFS